MAHVLKESELKETIQKSIDRFLRKMKSINCSEKDTLGLDDSIVNKQKNEPMPIFLTLSEKKMQKLDMEIKKEIEEALKSDKKIVKIDLFKSESSSSFIKKKKAVESKIKAARRIDPEYLIHIKSKEKKDQIKEETKSLANNFRSVSTFNISPSDSRVTPARKEISKSSWFDNIKKISRDETGLFRSSPSVFSDFSSIAKDFVKNSQQMERSLRNAFRSKVNVQPVTLMKRMNSYKSWN